MSMFPTNAVDFRRKMQFPYESMAEPVDGDPYNWQGVITGPQGSPYEGGKFSIAINLSPDYPLYPPIVLFNTPIYHPNIRGECGVVCVDLRDKNKSREFDIAKALTSICSLMFYPNPYDPLELDIAKVYIQDIERYNKTAREWTQLFAIDVPPGRMPIQT